MTRLILKFALIISTGLILSSCSKDALDIDYSYPKSRDVRENERIGELMSEPVYIFKSQEKQK